MRELLDHLELRGIAGPTASLSPLGDGWLFLDLGRRYRLSGATTLEGWVSSNYYVTGGDVSIAWCRHEAAVALARGDAELELEIRRDLWRLSMATRFARIASEDLGGLEDEAEGLEEERRDVLIQGLGLEALAAVAGVAADDGAQVLVAEMAQ